MSTRGIDASVWAARKNSALPGRTPRPALRLAARFASRTGRRQRSMLIALTPDRESVLTGDMRPSRLSPRGLGCGDRGRASSVLVGAGWHRRPPGGSSNTQPAGQSASVSRATNSSPASAVSTGLCPFRQACAMRAALAGRRLNRAVRCGGLGGDVVVPQPSNVPTLSDTPVAPAAQETVRSLPAASAAINAGQHPHAPMHGAASKQWLDGMRSGWAAEKRPALMHSGLLHKRLRRTAPSKLRTASAGLERSCSTR